MYFPFYQVVKLLQNVNKTGKLSLYGLFAGIIIIISVEKTFSFGFFAHRIINRMAVYALPPEMLPFYKNHIEYITEHAIDPDKRSRIVKGEDKKHYIDLEYYGEHPFDSIPIYWNDAVKKYTEDTIQRRGINPWWINKMLYSLTQAFKDEDLDNILFLSANIGHYIGDACTPLHTTEWYDGKIPEQKGIHSFWETRIPELKADKYNFMVGLAEYIGKPNQYFWQIIKESYGAADTIFSLETYLRMNFKEDKQFVYEERNSSVKKQFAKEFAYEFDKLSGFMVERRMKSAVRAISNAWFTAWVNAGQPDLKRLEDKKITKVHKYELKETEKMWRTGNNIKRLKVPESAK